jgi:hypothetical protein
MVNISTKTRKILIVSYILLIMFSFLYVRWVLNTERIDIVTDSPPPPATETQTFRVYLIVDTGTTQYEYSFRLQNTNSVMRLIDEARKEDNLTYETEQYVDRMEFAHVMGIVPGDNRSWRVFYEGEDITYKVEDIKLSREAEYTLKLVNIEDIN